jgi:hypothetical protein
MSEKINYKESQEAVNMINELLDQRCLVEIRIDLRELLDFYILNSTESEGRAINLYKTIKYLTDFTYNIEAYTN